MHISNRLFAAHLVAFVLVSTALPVLAAGYTQKASSWWGDPAVPAPNHVEMTIDGVQPDATVNGTISFTLTCKLPQPSTLKLDTIVIQVDGNNVQAYYGTSARAILGLPRTFNVDTTKFSDGWHELQARCYAMETTIGPELGKQTQVTNGHQLYFKNGNAFVDNRSVTPGIVDAHSWYDTDAATGDSIDYVYVQIVNVHPLIQAPLKGVVPVTGLVTNAGPTPRCEAAAHPRLRHAHALERATRFAVPRPRPGEEREAAGGAGRDSHRRRERPAAFSAGRRYPPATPGPQLGRRRIGHSSSGALDQPARADLFVDREHRLLFAQ